MAVCSGTIRPPEPPPPPPANEVPIRADFVAMRIDVGEDDVVEVHAPPYEETWGVRLFRREDLAEG